MSNINRINKFLSFVVDFKLPKMLKKMSDIELIKLHQQYSPLYFTPQVSPNGRGKGAFITSAIMSELKRRYPSNPMFKSYDFQHNIQLTEENMYGKPKKHRKHKRK